MELRSLLLTIGAMAVIFLLVPMVTAQTTQTIWIYGNVRVGNNLTDNIQVTLTGPLTGNPTTYTSVNGTNHGYYQFSIDNGSSGDYTVYTSYYNTTYHGSIHVTGAVGHLSDIIIPATAPTPTPSPTVITTPTPRPSGELGGLVTRNDQSSFIPLSATKISTTPIPRASPTHTPTAVPDKTSTPTPTPATGLLSNIYIWLVIALIAILTILAIAAAAFLLLKSK